MMSCFVISIQAYQMEVASDQIIARSGWLCRSSCMDCMVNRCGDESKLSGVEEPENEEK